MSVLPLTMIAPSASISRSRSIDAGRIRAVEHEVAGDRDEVRLLGGVSALRTASSAGSVAVDVGQHDERGSSQDPLARDDEAERRLAGDLAVDAGDAAAAAEAAAELAPS